MSKTPNRSVRIPDALWNKVRAKAKEQHTTATAIIIRLLREWVNK